MLAKYGLSLSVESIWLEDLPNIKEEARVLLAMEERSKREIAKMRLQGLT